ncbi:glyoxylase-like metal-dependent hydrolase (beta-lactamase superfamily II) [Halopolyspora algeriensis]|uniref:Glyoxylase-like metal-dependent hydrolase (Beta-lactamase superfamily II) n=1 Tax=Halopolyspora algeriensis TaxID=1500506 RepID=A0A368VPW6_9ACTN|nr:MBL fold metallo-hydrolase [Halopolyspora algeriensis]RCW43901.1 glyoxylase-like metal-dependent hydrolase (beta-lactamase superfamily II) [Halopolyspora algeriensis]TQM53596.1 glyoxylase-like metal-dependent hydrolase (beta-lactamase superfamily II) [Halopolyspora algeriensis]
MLVVGFPVGQLQANCYVLAPAEGGRCVVVDPGQDAVEAVEERLRKHQLTPEGVLLTHGHFDHVFSAADLCRNHGIPAWVHPDDSYMLTDPGAALGPQGRQLFEGVAVSAPPDIRELADGDRLDLAGIRFEAVHAPGHTGGSMLFGAESDEGGRLLLSGDTLFAGAIGRTDLPGGDHERMLETLRSSVLTLEDETVVLPGHGPTTTIGRERAGNPFLQGLGEASASTGPVPGDSGHGL